MCIRDSYTTGDKRDAVYVPADATGVTKDNRGGSAKGAAARCDLTSGKYLGEPTRAQAAAAQRRNAERESHANRHAGGKGKGKGNNAADGPGKGKGKGKWCGGRSWQG